MTAVTVPSAATWQVTPAGQAPSRTAPVPVRRPASRIAAQPAGRARLGGGDQRDARPCRARCRAGVGQVAVVRAAEPGQGELEGFQFGEGGLQGGGDGQAGDGGGAGAGQQPGGVDGRDDHGGQPAPGGRGLGEQGGEDRAGGRRGAGAGQAEAAEGRDVDADGGLGVVAADADRDRAGRQLAPGGVLRSRLRRVAGVRAGRCGAVAVRVRPGAGLVQVEVRVAGVRLPASGPPAGSGGRAARRRALMTSGSGGVSGASVLGGPGRGR